MKYTFGWGQKAKKEKQLFRGIRRRLLTSVWMLAVLVGTATICSGNYSGGSGDPNDPYQIANVADFNQLTLDPNNWNKAFILTADINLTGRTFTKAPIAPDTNADSDFQGTPFTGIFDGNGHIISKLTITTSTKDYIGLFGYVGSGGQIHNLGVKNVNITGDITDHYVGGLVGYTYQGTLTDCNATGSVNGTGAFVGGLVGYTYQGTLTDCYATGSVSGSDSVGGLVGRTYQGTLTSCYAAGSVTGKTFSMYINEVGGLVGANYGSITSCYATGAVSVSADGSFIGGLVGRNYSGSLTSCYATGSVTGKNNCDTVGGLAGEIDSGTLTSCYATGSVSGYGVVGGLVGDNYVSLTDCHATGSVSGYSNLGGLVGAGGSSLTSCYATGSVSGTGDHVGGLVGFNYDYGSLTSCYATGDVNGTGSYVGGLAGEIDSGTLTSCYATGDVNGTALVGGLVGYDNYVSLTSCYATGSVSGYSSVGGLVGWNYHGSLTSCYATGSVSGTGNYDVGGLVGENDCNLISCYATGSVSGKSRVGGLAGGNYGSITSCFWDINTSGTTDGVGNVNPDPNGVAGKTTAEMKTESTFTSAGWDFTTIWAICEGTNYPRLRWQIPAADWVCLDGVNFVDFAYFAARWPTTGCDSSNNFCGGADMDTSGTVDIFDLAEFAEYWLSGS
jgi:hypothetical protein